MVELDHHYSPSEDDQTEQTSRRNSRVGLGLFAIYSSFYTGYVLLAAFARKWMETELSGINLATLYGLFLIAFAFMMALVYGWVCRSPVSPHSGKEPTS